MTREKVYEKLTRIFRELFDDERICIEDETVAGDIDGWDSFMHVTLIGVIENEFGITFNMKDVMGMKNVGQMADVILRLS